MKIFNASRNVAVECQRDDVFLEGNSIKVHLRNGNDGTLGTYASRDEAEMYFAHLMQTFEFKVADIYLISKGG